MRIFTWMMVVSCALAANLGLADDVPIKNFHYVSPGVYRGAYPGKKGIQYLETLKVKTIISLKGTRFWAFIPEKFEAKHADMDFIRKPLVSLPGFLGDLTEISEEKVDAILTILADPDQQPVFVHCEKGEDRTGFIIGLHDVINLHMDPKDAWADMLKYGYHPHFTALTKYFEKKTGFNPNDAAEEESSENSN